MKLMVVEFKINKICNIQNITGYKTSVTRSELVTGSRLQQQYEIAGGLKQSGYSYAGARGRP